jgi:hypothetical protein
MKQRFKPRVLREKSKVADPLRIPFVTTGGLDGEILLSQQQGSIGTPPYTSHVPFLSYLEYIQQDKYVGLLYLRDQPFWSAIAQSHSIASCRMARTMSWHKSQQ